MKNRPETELVPAKVRELEVVRLFEKVLSGLRDDLHENPYILEVLRVLPAKGYRSAIGSLWNAVVDDLRNKIIHRSLELFNKSLSIGREIKTYEDFQSYVNDDQLIEGAFRIGVIGYEASKVLIQAKQTRHLFDGHPKSSEPSIIKVLAMMDDCIKYVLNEPFPAQIIDLDEYMQNLTGTEFDRNGVAIEVALTELPEIYKNELAHRLFSSYIHPGASSTLRSNIEYVVPILWRVLSRAVQVEIVRRVDKEMLKGNAQITGRAFSFVSLVGAMIYLSPAARRYKVQPLVDKLKASLDKWDIENDAVKKLFPFAAVIPEECVSEYVWALTHTYVGCTGFSTQYSRTDFYADEAALSIPKMFEMFDDKAAEAFIMCILESEELKRRIRNPQKLARLRSLGNIVQRRISKVFPYHEILDALVDPDGEQIFIEAIR
jgi:hypothetical protein